MKKVLFISSQPFFQWRGSPIRVGFDVRVLAEAGFAVDLLTLPIGDSKEITGVRVIRTPNLFLVKNVPIGPSLAKAAFDVLLFFHGILLIVRNRYSVIHCVEDAGVIGVALSRIARVPLVFEKHSDPLSYGKGRFRNILMKIYGRVEVFVARCAAATIGTGQGLVDQLLAMGTGRPVHHIFDIPSSLTRATPEKTAAVRNTLKHEPNEMLIMFVGSFAVYQGVDLILESVAKVVSLHSNARFIIIGGTSAEIAARKKIVDAAGCSSAVSFIGKVHPDKLPNYLAAADILLSPRLAGVNTPLKILDYLKAGRAIVATDTESNRLILDRGIALLAKPDSNAFAEAICALLSNDSLKNELARKGHDLIENLYNFEEFKRRLIACYDEILETKEK
ncbi:MAG: glycosyltransferase [Lentisphaerae bacterium]|nr:glycosyltransferase [Lentisphaerota bacterium]